MNTESESESPLPGTWQWCEEHGRVEAQIGHLGVYLAPQDIEKWNAAAFAGEIDEIRCHVPTTDRGMPTAWFGTIGDAVASGLLDRRDVEEMEYYPAVIVE